MTAYLKKSFVYKLHYWIEQKLGIILIPLSKALDGGVLVILLKFPDDPDDDTIFLLGNTILYFSVFTNVVIE